jgi:chromosome segregation ATPase
MPRFEVYIALDEMKPENVTISEIIGALNPKHWVAIISTVFAVFSAVAYGGFWAGQKLAESQAFGQTAELKATVGQLQAKLEVAQSKIEATSTAVAQCKEAYGKVQELLAQKSQEVAQLSHELGRSNNCAFVQKQIIATCGEIASVRNPSFWSAGKEFEQQQQNRLAELEKRLALYQQQLGTCGR